MVLPRKGGVKVVGLIGALLGPHDGHFDDVTHDFLQGLAVFFIQCQHEERKHDQHHTHGSHAVPHRYPEQKEKRYTDECTATEADQLPLG